MTSRLLEAKLQELRFRVSEFLGKQKVLLHELQVLVGYLNLACKVVAPGQAFLKRLCDAKKGVK